MTSTTTQAFRKAFEKLPPHVQVQARKAYRLFRNDPSHPSLEFKQVHPSRPLYSARVSLGYRALCVRDGEDLVWFWVGKHSDYEKLLSRK